MDQILVYSDSLAWGIVPGTRERFSFDKRWPGVFESALKEKGREVRVIENCLNGRRTAWSDPFKAGRSGSDGLEQVIEMHSPLRLVILMLGSNDFQCTHDNNAWLSAQGTARLIRVIRHAPIEPEMPVPDILVVAPPEIVEPKGEIAEKFDHAEERNVGLPAELKKIAREQQAHFCDINDVTTASRVDGIHFDEDQHLVVGVAVAEAVERLVYS